MNKQFIYRVSLCNFPERSVLATGDFEDVIEEIEKEIIPKYKTHDSTILNIIRLNEEEEEIPPSLPS